MPRAPIDGPCILMLVTKDILDLILENKKSGTTLLIKDFYKDVPSWDDFIKYIHDASHEEGSFPNPLPKYDLDLGGKAIGSVLIKQNFYFYVSASKGIGNSDKIFREFALFYPDFSLINLYINLSNKIDNVPNHRDNRDNFYWQCQGSVEWKANGNTYLVEPGDLVYIPANTYHAVNFFGPRSAVGFSCDING